MPRLKIDYSKTIIYKLVKNDDYENENIYVGSTTDFTSRKSQHKNCCYNENSKLYNCKVYQNIRANGGWENWTMIEIEKFPCEDKREAEAREEYWRCEFNANLNSKRAFRNEEQRKEQQKQYSKTYNLNNADKNKQRRIENADYEKERHYKYYTKNAEKLNEYQKQYYTENADKLRQKYDCDCGSVYTHKSKSQHFKSKKHQNYIKNKIETILGEIPKL